MYENENKNMNGLGNENMEHRDVPETTVNWTIPGDERNRQGQNTQGHRTMEPEARSQEAQVSIHRISIHRPRKARVPVSSIESSIPRDQMPYSVHTQPDPPTGLLWRKYLSGISGRRR